ncbi:MAG: hypothetical protein AB7S38_27680 [Vulcanimicrobiota bacterium]
MKIGSFQPNTPPVRTAAVSPALVDAYRPWQAEGDWQTGTNWRGQAIWKSNSGRYEDSQNTSLTSQPLSLRGLTQPRLKFRCGYGLEDSYDHVHLELKTEHGSWRELKDFTGKTWLGKDVDLDLSGYQGEVVQLRFRLRTDGSNSGSGFKFSKLRLEGFDFEGKPVNHSLQSTQGPDLSGLSDQQSAQLEQLTRQLGSPEDAYLLWQSHPNPQPGLVELTRQAGAAEAVASWPLVEADDKAQERMEWLRQKVDGKLARQVWPTVQAGDESSLEALAAASGSFAKAAQLWPLVAERRDQADFSDLLDGLGKLASEAEPEEIKNRWSLLGHGPQTLTDRLSLYRAARRLSEKDGVELYCKLVTAGADGSTGQTLHDLLSHNRDWSGDWGQEKSLLKGQVWSDSPGGKYASSARTSLTSPPIPLAECEQPKVHFSAFYSLEDGYDKVHLEAAGRDGHWRSLDTFTGSSWMWKHKSYALDAFGRQPVRFRFRLESDGSNEKDGFSLADLRVEDSAGRCLRPEGKPDAFAQPLVDFAIAHPDRLEQLGSVADQLGSVRSGLDFLQAFDTPANHPQQAQHRQALVELFDLAGSKAAAACWPLIKSSREKDFAGQAALLKWGLDQTGPDQLKALWPSLASGDQSRLAAFTRQLGSFESAASLWPLVSQRRHQPGFDGELTQLASLVETVGLDEARRRLSGQTDLESHLALEEVASRLAPGQSEPLSQRLHQAGLDPAGVKALLSLTEQMTFWKAEGSWGREGSLFKGSCWSDSPKANYPDSADYSLTSQPLDLFGLKEATLHLSSRFSLEDGYDFARLELGTADGRWHELHKFTGNRPVWWSNDFDLGDYAGQKVRLRFRLTSDGSRAKSGFSFAGLRLDGRAPDGSRISRHLDQPDRSQSIQQLVDLACDPNLPAAERSQKLQTLDSVSQRLNSPEAGLAFMPFDQSPERELVLQAFASCGEGAAGRAASLGVSLRDRDPTLKWLSQHGQTGSDEFWRRCLSNNGLVPSTLDRISRLAEQLARQPEQRQAFVEAIVAGGAWDIQQLHMLEGMAHNLTGWKSESGWGAERTWLHGKVWSDSPGGKTPSNADHRLVSSPLSLKGLSDTRLALTGSFSLEDGYDHLHVEVQAGGSWRTAESYTGRGFWRTREVDLSSYDGQDIQLRLRLNTDGSKNGDGFKLGKATIKANRNGKPVNLVIGQSPDENLASSLVRYLDKPETLGVWMRLVGLGMAPDAQHALLDLAHNGVDSSQLLKLLEFSGLDRAEELWQKVAQDPARLLPVMASAHYLADATDKPELPLYERLSQSRVEGTSLERLARQADAADADYLVRLAGSSHRDRDKALRLLASGREPAAVVKFLAGKSRGAVSVSGTIDFLDRLSRATLLEDTPLQELMESLYRESTELLLDDESLTVGDYTVEVRSE